MSSSILIVYAQIRALDEGSITEMRMNYECIQSKYMRLFSVYRTKIFLGRQYTKIMITTGLGDFADEVEFVDINGFGVTQCDNPPFHFPRVRNFIVLLLEN